MKKIQYRSPLAQAIIEAYNKGQDDEKLEPILLVNQNKSPIGRLRTNDGLIFANIRGEREVELTQALTTRDFELFPTIPLNLKVATMIQYHPDLLVKIAFPPIGILSNNLTEYLSKLNKKVLKCVESEKAIHLTYFFNGKQHIQYPNETRIIIPSHEAENLADFPSMKAPEVADKTIESIKNSTFDLIITNLSPCDVLGHIEDRNVVKKAIKNVDEQLFKIVKAAESSDYVLLITADHGLAEKWLYPDGSIDTGHTSSPVPCILVSEKGKLITLRKGGSLIDIAPTIFDLMGIKPPKEMEGVSIIKERNNLTKKKVLLLILDGWGYNPDHYGNLFMETGPLFMDDLKIQYPFTTLIASGYPLGMPNKTVGNSEIGHLHIGVGRRVLSDRMRIFDAIKNETFFTNPTFLEICAHVKKMNSSLHLLGIISFYSSHGSIKFLEALMSLSKRENIQKVFIHAMLGRRGEKPEAGAHYINKIEEKAKKLENIKVVSVIGRHWALDREENWDRIEKTYNLLVHGNGTMVPDLS